MDGLLLFAHGARDPRWAAPFESVAARVRALHPERTIALAYLEFLEPDLEAAGAELARSGCRSVIVLPLFLGAGGHVRKDLPERLRRLEASYPEVRWHLAPTVGERSDFVDALALIAARVLDEPEGTA